MVRKEVKHLLTINYIPLPNYYIAIKKLFFLIKHKTFYYTIPPPPQKKKLRYTRIKSFWRPQPQSIHP